MISWNEKSLLTVEVDMTIDSDASLVRWDAPCQTQRTGGLWSRHKTDKLPGVAGITAQHLSGIENKVADADSLTMRGRSDWQLNPVLFNRIAILFDPIEVNMFASCLTTQIKGYANPP